MAANASVRAPVAASAPGAASTSFDWIPKVKDFIGGTVVRSISEMYKLMPDSVLFGSLVLYFLTQNLAYGIFAAFIIELTLSHRLIAWVVEQSIGPPDTQKTVECRAGYKTPQMDVSRMFNHDPYPSYSIFSIVSMATYLGFATSEFSAVFQAMGDNWKTRSTLAYTFMGLVVLTFMLARIFVSDCGDTLGEILMAAGLAVAVGCVFFYINKAIFGQESMNFLGLPYLTQKGTDCNGNPKDIYVCAAV